MAGSLTWTGLEVYLQRIQQISLLQGSLRLNLPLPLTLIKGRLCVNTSHHKLYELELELVQFLTTRNVRRGVYPQYQSMCRCFKYKYKQKIQISFSQTYLISTYTKIVLKVCTSKLKSYTGFNVFVLPKNNSGSSTWNPSICSTTVDGADPTGFRFK